MLPPVQLGPPSTVQPPCPGRSARCPPGGRPDGKRTARGEKEGAGGRNGGGAGVRRGAAPRAAACRRRGAAVSSVGAALRENGGLRQRLRGRRPAAADRRAL